MGPCPKNRRKTGFYPNIEKQPDKKYEKTMHSDKLVHRFLLRQEKENMNLLLLGHTEPNHTIFAVA